MMKKTKCYKQIQRLLRTNTQSFRSFRRNIIFHKRSFICFGLLISLCIAIMFTGFNLIKAFRKDAAASLLPFAKNTLHVQFTASDTEENTSNIPSEETMQQFAASNSTYFKGILPFLSADTELRYNRTRTSVTAVGTSERFPALKDITLKEGRFFNSFDIEDNKKFIVLGSQVSEKLFPHDTPLGEKISLGNEEYTVIGTLDENESGFENIVFFPYTSNRQVFQTSFINQYLVFPKTGKTAKAKSALQDFLTDTLGDVTAFSIYSQENQIQKTDPLTGPYLWILWMGISFVGFLLLILLCVYLFFYYRSRKDEWKIRFLHGARPLQLFWQILIEGKYHGIFFMGTGILLGIAITLVATIILQLPLTLHLPSLFCLFLGIPILFILCSFVPAISIINMLKK